MTITSEITQALDQAGGSPVERTDPRTNIRVWWMADLPPSPRLRGEGRGEGEFGFDQRLRTKPPHPDPLPRVRGH